MNVNDGSFIEITVWLNDNKILPFIFDLDGYFVSLGLKETGRSSTILIMKRNYNGDFYLFPKI